MYSFTPSAERRLLWLLALTQFTLIMDFMVMMPLGPQIMRAYHISPAAFATAVSAYSWCAGLSGLLAAAYIDRFNRRSLLLVMYAVFALSNLACAYARSFELLLVARALAGMTGGVIGSVILAIVGDVIPAARRGAATGTIMASFSLAAVVGVPVGIVLGAQYGWGTPFALLFLLSMSIGACGAWIVPSLGEHLSHQVRHWREVVPELWALTTAAGHRNAFLLSFLIMVSQMLVLPFISPVLVANHGVPPANLAWLYVLGGIAPFFLSRRIGRWSDRYGHRSVFRILLLYSLLPILFITHLPDLAFWVIALSFPFFTIAMAGRMVPLQALLITVPNPSARGAFLSANSSFQSLGAGFGAWLGGLGLASLPDGTITGFGSNGWVAVALALVVFLWVGRVKSDARTATGTTALGNAAPAHAAAGTPESAAVSGTDGLASPSAFRPAVGEP